MKTALCLSGQTRFVKQCYDEILYPYILKGNNIDVFIHTWDIDKSQINKHFINSGGHMMGSAITENQIQETLDLYNPVSYKVESQIQFELNKFSERTLSNIRSDYLYSMFYSIYQSNKLKIEYEEKNNFKYDWVIRSRFDVKINERIDFHRSYSGVINVPSGCFNSEKGYTDCFAFSNSKNMDVYSNTYNHIDDCMNNDPTLQLCGEYILRRWIDINKIPVVSSIWHSLYR
jgi:hypothetical protein